MRERSLAAALALLVLCGASAGRLGRGDLEQVLRERTPECPRPLPGRDVPPRRAGSVPGRPVRDSIIRDDFLCNDDATGGTRQDGPSVSVGPDGGFVVSWYEFRDGDADIWYQRFDSAGIAIGRNQRANTDATMGWQGDPAVAVAPDGRFVFTWEDRREIGNSDVFCQRFSNTGQRVGDNFRVSDSGAPGDQSFSGVHLGPDGTALVAWDDRRYGITGDIFAQFLNPDGTPRGANFRVNDDQVGWANQYEPAVGGDDSGRFVVTWMDGRGRNAYDWNVFCQRFDRMGNRLGTNIQVTTNDSIQWAPGLAVARAGPFAVCWEDRRTGQWDAYAQFYDAAGRAVGGNVRVNDDAGLTDQTAAAAAANTAGEFLVVWADRRNGNSDVYAQRFSPSGSALGTNFIVNDDGTGTDQFAPAAAGCPDGGYRVCWVDNRNGNPDIYCRRFSIAGSPRGPSFRVNDDSVSSHQRVSSIAMDAAGTTVIAWEDERNGGTDIFRCVLDAGGQPLAPNLRVNDDAPGGAAQYYAAAAGGRDRFLVTWTDNRDGFNIYGRFLGAAGEPAGPNFKVNSDTANAHQWYSHCAMDTSNRSVIVWMDMRDWDASRIFCRLYDALGNPQGAEFAVSDGGGSQYYASAAKNSNGRFVAAWMDYRDPDGGIYCQLFEPDGSRLGANIRVDADSVGAYQGYPSCAFADDGRFVVAWEDTRNDRYDVYMQWFDSAGTRLGGNERVNDNATQTDCYSPSCAFDRSGRLAILLNDERDTPGAPQIYGQRFRPDRSRMSGNQLFSQPPHFPSNHHWTVGQSVAVSERIVAGAWTDNRRHQGWDIYAKFTDWDLVGVHEPVVSTRREPGQIRPTVSAGCFQVAVDAASGYGRLVVLDRTGRRVHEARLRAGSQLVDLSHLGRGVYFCRVETTGQTRCCKLIVR